MGALRHVLFWSMLALANLSLPTIVLAQTNQTTALLAEGRQIAQRYGNQLWPGFSQTRFDVLLVTQQQELLFCAKNRPDGFEPWRFDPETSCPVYIRKPGQFSPKTQVTLHLDGSGPTIVMGEPQSLEDNPAAWLATLWHEHFHQYQMSRLRFQNRPDQTDPFSYSNPVPAKVLTTLSRQLAEILRQPDRKTRLHLAQAYATNRTELLSHLSDPDQTYLEFQLWQEGVARYTELAMAEFAAGSTVQIGDTPHDFAALAANLRRRVLQVLSDPEPMRHQRVLFYSIGAAEALVLDEINPHWRSSYLTYPFALKNHFAKIVTTPVSD
ncbi:MAG: hypothetical protein COA47_00805 [Robiginitomaculum sp.]|nr:MAG: hypothetical protein COA47_00805 [Robiginitomaculum sp.]